MTWTVEYSQRPEKTRWQPRKLVRKATAKVSENPLPVSDGGFGHPLGNKGGNDLTGFLKIKLRSSGIRVVYKVARQNNDMVIIVIGVREDDEVYDISTQRIEKNGL